MDKHKPKYFIETRFEKREDYNLPEPYQTCNGVRQRDFSPNTYEAQHWGTLYWESRTYNEVVRISRYNEEIWGSENIRKNTFEIIFEAYNAVQGEGVYTPLRDFEVYLLNKGYRLLSFDKMCAQTPGFNIVGSKTDGNYIYAPLEVWYSRVYRNPTTNRAFAFAFGISSQQGPKFNFYFVCTDMPNEIYQQPFKADDFDAAYNLQTPTFTSLIKEAQTIPA